MVELVVKRDMLREQIERLKDRALSDWMRKQREDRTQVEFTLREQDLAVSRKMQEMLLEKIKEIDFIGDTPAMTARILEEASIPRKPTSPNVAMNLLLGALAGLAGGVLLALFRIHAQSQVVSASTPDSSLPGSVIAAIPHIVSASAAMDVQLGRDLSSPTAEAFRAMRTAMVSALKKAGGQTILITSPESGEGKSLVSMGLAHSFADFGLNVLLVDADMRRGRLRVAFGIEKREGLSDIVSGRDDVVPHHISSHLHFIPCGSKTDRPSELLGRERIKEFFGWACSNYDIVLVDAPPLLAVTDASLLAAYATLRCMIIREHKTHIRVANLAADVLGSLGYEITGVILNDIKPDRTRYGYGYGYRYGYGSDSNQK
jgi:tyrosine-protein kinase Etk/Wzc